MWCSTSITENEGKDIQVEREQKYESKGEMLPSKKKLITDRWHHQHSFWALGYLDQPEN